MSFTNRVSGAITFCPTSQRGFRGARCTPSFTMQPADDKKKKDAARKSAKEDKEPVNKSEGKARKKCPKAKFGTSSKAGSCLAKQLMTNSGRKFPTSLNSSRCPT